MKIKIPQSESKDSEIILRLPINPIRTSLYLTTITASNIEITRISYINGEKEILPFVLYEKRK